MILLTFVGLQLMDTLTTLLFLRHGVTEANPLIRSALASAAQPAMSLAVAKIFGISLATLAWRSGRKKLLRAVNVLFAGFVVWNLIAAWVGQTAA